MNKSAKNYVMVVLLSAVSVLAIVNWYVTGDPSRFFLLAHSLEVRNDNIENVTVDFADRKVYLNVTVKKPTTCKKIVADLGINTIIVGSKSYAPTCTVIDRTLIRITYKETTNV
jgi:hypothetical protein